MEKNEVDYGGPKQICKPKQEHSYAVYKFYVVFDELLKSQGMICF